MRDLARDDATASETTLGTVSDDWGSVWSLEELPGTNDEEERTAFECQTTAPEKRMAPTIAKLGH